jgi:single-strand DNA-binding protein
MNKSILIGRWTKDLECKQAGSTVVAEGALAIDRKPGKDGQKQADFITVVLFGAMAENTAKFCGKKGNLIGISGHLQSSTYKDKHDSTHYVTKVVADETQWLESKNSNTTQTPAAEYESEMTPVDDGDIPF